jgi:hypothetical protein
VIAELYVEWCKTMFNLIAPGGEWVVPRSGLIFQKTDNHTLSLVKVISPEDSEYPVEQDFEVIREHFEMAGIRVVDTGVLD